MGTVEPSVDIDHGNGICVIMNDIRVKHKHGVKTGINFDPIIKINVKMYWQYFVSV